MKKVALIIALLVTFSAFIIGGRYVIGHQMIDDFQEGHYAKSMTRYNKFGPYLSPSNKEELNMAFKDYLLTTEDLPAVTALTKALTLIDDQSLVNQLFPLETQKQIFTALDHHHRVEIFMTLYYGVKSHAQLTLTTTATDLLYQQAPVLVHESGILIANDFYGTVTYSLENSQTIFIQLDDGPITAYTTPLATTPKNNQLSYYTTNVYGMDSTTTVLSLNQLPFTALIPLKPALTTHHLDYHYSYAARNPLDKKQAAIFFYDDTYLISDKIYTWSLDTPRSALKLSGIIRNVDGYVPLDDLSNSDQVKYLDAFSLILSAMDTEETFYLTQIIPPLPDPFSDTSNFQTWRSFKEAAESLLPPAENSYRNHNLLIGRISEEAPILYVKIFDEGSNNTEGIRIVFGDTYANIYAFVQEQLVINNPLLVPTHYEETPLYSAHLDRSPFEYRQKIQDLAVTFKDRDKTVPQIVESVGGYIIELIDYDRKNLLAYDSHTPYKALDEGLGVCESYAGLAHDLLNALGINTFLIHADDENSQDDTHAYNLVDLGDRYAFYDFTWADKSGWIDKRYYGFDLGFHPYKPYVSQTVIDAFDLK